MADKSTEMEAQSLALYALDVFVRAYEKYPTDNNKRFRAITQRLPDFKAELDAIVANHTS